MTRQQIESECAALTAALNSTAPIYFDSVSERLRALSTAAAKFPELHVKINDLVSIIDEVSI